MDRRLTPGNERVALDGWQDRISAARYVPGEAARLAPALADLLKAPDGPRDRQLVHGAQLLVIERQAGWAFVQALADGYCGWLPEDALASAEPATHWLCVPASHLYQGPRVQHPVVMPLFMGAQLTVTGQAGAWAETPAGFVPACHLKPMGHALDDPASVAQMFLHSPYLWGGNSHAGLDCSGLAQISFAACGIQIPGDSDLQTRSGTPIPESAPLQRNDLLFWKGHVAICLSATRMIHATGAFMAVIEEDIAVAVARIEAAGDGPVTHRRRLAVSS